MPEPPSGTVAFLITDIEGSTRLWESAPDAMRQALERHDVLLRAAIDTHAGYVFATGGDGFGAAFARASDALAAAVEAQDHLAVEAWPEGAAIRVRMGVHIGETVERNGDYFGPAVNRTACLMAVAHGGQVVCSQPVEAVAGQGTELRRLGEHRLRDLAAPETVFQTGDGDFPPLRSVDAVPTNLPIVRTELIGRSEEVAALSKLVGRERLVTLTGVGGVGKTRLALGVAATAAADFPDGCWLVELAPVTGGDEVVKAVAVAMQSRTTGIGALTAYLTERQLLIVLDNCEHVLDSASDLVDAVIAAAPDVRILITSREPLGLEGEQVRRVQSLELPVVDAALDDALKSASVRLFTDRAKATADGFTIDDGNLAAVAEICRHLDGIPLALELAAALVRAMSPEEIARRLDERFRILAGGSRRSQERHRTLLATVSWSHELLTEDEKATFRRLAVFPASFDLAAAESVVGGESAGPNVMDCVLRLVDRSLVQYESESGRYRLLETLRQYGADRLADAGETEESRERHARHFLSVSERAGPLLEGAQFPKAVASLRIELDNLRATADWCVEVDWWVEFARMCDELWYFIQGTVPLDTMAWYGKLIDHDEELGDQGVADALGALAFLQVSVGYFSGALALSEQSRELSDAKELQMSQMAWLATAMASQYLGDNTAALHAGERALAAAEARGDQLVPVTALCAQLPALVDIGEFDRGVEMSLEALRQAEQTGHPSFIGAAAISAAAVHLQSDEHRDFAAAFEILDRYSHGLAGGDSIEMWLDIYWGTVRMGLGHSGAAESLASGVRIADRLNSQHALDLALRILAIVAAKDGLGASALAIAAYSETNLRLSRFDNSFNDWVQSRLDDALVNASGGPTAELHRKDVMQLVTEIDTALASGEPRSRSLAD